MPDKKINKTIILLSGGMDSLLCLAEAHARGDELFALHFSYGQRTQTKELACFEQLCQHYGIDQHHRQQIHLPLFQRWGGSALTDQGQTLSETGENLEHQVQAKIPNSYVPFRNSMMLAMATSWAEIIGAKKISIGAVEEDATGYPDCRRSYFASFNELIAQGTGLEDRGEEAIQVITPVIQKQKAEIIRDCVKLKAPLELSWSCYQQTDRPCGKCDSCRLRAKAFSLTGIYDPLI